MKDIEKEDYILWVKILRDHLKQLLSLSQKGYIDKVLEQDNMKDCNPEETPIAKNHKLNKDNTWKIEKSKE